MNYCLFCHFMTPLPPDLIGISTLGEGETQSTDLGAAFAKSCGTYRCQAASGFRDFGSAVQILRARKANSKTAGLLLPPQPNSIVKSSAAIASAGSHRNDGRNNNSILCWSGPNQLLGRRFQVVQLIVSA